MHSFIKLLKKKRRTPYEKALIMAVSSLSVTKKFKRMTPHAIFDWLVSNGLQLF
jgi:hypothetical protein